MRIMVKDLCEEVKDLMSEFAEIGSEAYTPEFIKCMEICPICKGEKSKEVDVFGRLVEVKCTVCKGKGELQVHGEGEWQPVKTTIEYVYLKKSHNPEEGEVYEIIYTDENNEDVYEDIKTCQRVCDRWNNE